MFICTSLYHHFRQIMYFVWHIQVFGINATQGTSHNSICQPSLKRLISFDCIIYTIFPQNFTNIFSETVIEPSVMIIYNLTLRSSLMTVFHHFFLVSVVISMTTSQLKECNRASIWISGKFHKNIWQKMETILFLRCCTFGDYSTAYCK